MSPTVERELRDIRNMPYGTARISAAEAITRRIEAEGPRGSLPEALLDLVEAYTFAGEGAKSFVAFARTLRLWDESPELFDEGDERNLFWEFKWVAGDLPDYPQVRAEQAEAFLADMERRFDLAGHGLSSVRMSRFRWAWHAGRPDAEEQRLAWITGLRDEFEDCRACTIGQQVDFFTETGRHAEAVELGLTQDSKCNLEPARTYHSLALSALLNGDPELAERSFQQAMATVEGGRDGSDGLDTEHGQGFEMLARGGRLERALRKLRNDYPGLLTKGSTPLFHLRFLLGVLAGLSANLDRGSTETGLQRPEWATLAELHAWVLTEAEPIARRIDERNGTDMYARLLERALAATRAEQQLPEISLEFAADLSASVSGPGSGAGPSSDERIPAGTGGDAVSDTGSAGFQRAEELALRKDFGAAARAYADAAEALEQEGWMERAGLAYAEAAQCAALAGEEEAAHTLFGAAVPRMRSGGADDEAMTAVLGAWAPVAARMADPEAQLRATAEELERYDGFDPSGLSEELAERRRAEWSRRRAQLRDTLARSIAAADPARRMPPFSIERAISEAGLAGEEFAQLGLVFDAAHAFWAAGRAQREIGDTAGAIWSLESAFEGFGAVRRREDRANAAGELIELLRETGQADRAEEIVAQL